MPELLGFQGVRFDKNRVGTLDGIVTPPYDVITPAERQTLAAANPYSMVHLMLPEADGERDAYTVAGDLFEAWLDVGVLREDDAPSLYLLEQTFADSRGGTHVRRGFFALARLPEAGERTVLGHEHTFSKVVGDRLRLYEATRANFEPVFALYADAERVTDRILSEMNEREADLEAQSMDGVTQRLWRVDCAPGALDFFRDKCLYIADGHHRFRTACEYRDAMRERERPDGPRPYDFVMMGFVSMSDPGLLVYPTHRLMAMPAGLDEARLMSALAPWFECEKVDGDLGQRVETAPGSAIGMAFAGGGQYVLRLREDLREELLAGLAPSLQALDVEVLHKGIIERALGLPADTPMAYEREAQKALADVQSGEHDIAFVLKACTTEQIRACAEAGEAMPHKSTYFFPKLPSGTVMYRHG